MTDRVFPDFEAWLAGQTAAPGLAASGVARALAQASHVADALAFEACSRETAFAESLGRAGSAQIVWPDAPAVRLPGDGPLAVSLAHAGGAADIAANAATGVIFGVWPDANEPGSAVGDGKAILAAGYILWGPRTILAVTLGAGVGLFAREPGAEAFSLVDADVRIPDQMRDVDVDMSNHRYWHHPVRLFVDDCLAGAEGPRGVDYIFRGTCALAAQTQRILALGGVYIEPADHRPGRQSGGARLAFEALPIALLMQGAGGAASDTYRAILSRAAADPNARTPLVFGSPSAVKLVEAYHLGPVARMGEAPLFGRRGLYRK